MPGGATSRGFVLANEFSTVLPHLPQNEQNAPQLPNSVHLPLWESGEGRATPLSLAANRHAPKPLRNEDRGFPAFGGKLLGAIFYRADFETLGLARLNACGQFACCGPLFAQIAELAWDCDVVPMPRAVGMLPWFIFENFDTPVVYAAFEFVSASDFAAMAA